MMIALWPEGMTGELSFRYSDYAVMTLIVFWLAPTLASIALCLWKRRYRMALVLGALSLGIPVAIVFGVVFLSTDDGSNVVTPAFIGFAYGLMAAVGLSVISLLVALFIKKRTDSRPIDLEG